MKIECTVEELKEMMNKKDCPHCECEQSNKVEIKLDGETIGYRVENHD